MRFGAHVSIAGGFARTVEYAVSVGCECMQVFSKSPRQWRNPPTDPEAARVFRELRSAAELGPLFTHTAYLINLSTDDEVLRERSTDALADELARGALLGAEAVVTHIGTVADGDAEAAARRTSESVLRAFDVSGADVRLLLENTAGAGTTFGCTLEQLALVIQCSDLPVTRLGICLDTCHAFAFGFALESQAGWRELVVAMERTTGVERVGLIHANDCLYERGSRRDRHAWIGDGSIGIDGFAAMVCTPQLSALCAVTEMPGDAPEKDVVNLERLKEIRADCDGRGL